MSKQTAQQDGVKPIESPSGIDLYPAPPVAVRLNKRAGVLVLFVLACVIGLIGYGIVTRREHSFQMTQSIDTRNLTAATDAGKAIAAQVPTRVLIGQTGDGQERLEADGDQRDSANRLQPDSPNQAHGYQPPPQPRAYSSYPHTQQFTEASVSKEPTIAERRAEMALQQEMAALESPTATGGEYRHSTSQQPQLPNRERDLSQMTELLNAMRGPSAGSNPRPQATNLRLASLNSDNGHGGQNFSDQNAQTDKRAFIESARSSATEVYLKSTRTRPLSKFEIKAGWDIPAVLEQALNSDLPGEVRALVRENVYDTATGDYLLIPQGSRLIGEYDSRISYGQDGVMVVWNRLIFPDASSISLGGMPGQDTGGRSGLRHDVDNHYLRLLSFAALTSGFSAAFQLSQSPRGGLLGYPSAGEIAGSAIGRELSQFGAQITRRNLNIQPTIKVPIGYRFNVRVNRDIVFDGPYRPRRM